jgi:hypothetical protein
MATTPGKRVFGELEKRKSATTGKATGWRARYTGPDLARHPKTFSDKMAAEAWLNAERILIDRGEWKPPKVRELEARLAEQRAVRCASGRTGRSRARPCDQAPCTATRPR